jgi:uncharacterized protein
MLFEWDEEKRRSTLKDRGLDFADAPLFFDGRPAVTFPTPRGEEPRWKTTARIHGAFFTLVWTWRGRAIRVISMRRARGGEAQAHRALHR